MANVVFTPTRSGLRAVANSGEVGGVCLRAAQVAASQAHAMYPGNYVVDVRPGKFRQHAKVKLAIPDSFIERRRMYAARPLSRVHPHL